MTQLDAIELLSRYETPLIKDMEKDDDVLEWVAAFVGSDRFQDAIDAFCEEHAEQFKVLNAKGGPSADLVSSNDSAWRALHEQFLATANNSIEGFLVERGFSMQLYHARCEEEMRLSEERQRHTRLSFFVQILMACAEYEQFLNLMKRAADPDYYAKKELQYEAEIIVQKGAETPGAANPQQVSSAKGFLDFFNANPDASLDTLEQEFRQRMQLS
ncbi:TPA: hypothetical protein N0F65_003387 [Lagenidium giganteum]|uniref:Cilia- and flagella-associated protein 36 n=1 Tax=Lagenidium giganteum TaxID=4803 RepID=A0AAV2YXT7_9STRA|nr:TPA: hypothetical protein N0F65_003387 [Lagenidium giganteum]